MSSERDPVSDAAEIAAGETETLPETAGAPARRRRSRREIAWRTGAIIFSIAVTLGIILSRHQIERLGSWGLLGIFLISLLGNATLILPAPSLAMVFAMGGALPPLQVGLVAGIGMALGELTGYIAGFGGSAIIENRARYEKVKAYMKKYGLLTIFLLSLIPNPIADLAGIAAGTLKMPVWQFLLACAAGKILKNIGIAYLGAGALPAVSRLFRP